MTQTTTGWVVFVAAVGMMFGLLSVDIMALKDWNSLATPTFIGTFLGHLAAVIAAFIGGKIIPPDRGTAPMTRAGDPPQPQVKP